MAVREFSRQDVLAHRWSAQGLDRPATGVPAVDLGVTDLGVTDVPTPAARTALAVRGAVPAGDDLALVWGARGAPALHRRSDLQWWVEALWPVSDTDATRRIANPRIADGAAMGLEAFRVTAAAVADVLAGVPAGELVSKADLSHGVTERVPDALSYDCEPCGSRHVSGSVLQDAGFAGGAELVRVGRAARFRALPGITVPQNAAGTDEAVRTHLHLLGPANRADVASYFGTSAGELGAVWPPDAVEVSVEGRRVWANSADVGSLAGRSAPRGVRLLPPGDPWLQARDRDLTVPVKAHHRSLWKAISPPGAVLADGEVVGTWRAATKGRRLDVTVQGFSDLSAARLKAAEAELEFLAAARGLSDARLV